MSPTITWYGSPNFTPGRTDVEYVVIHWMDGYLAGADATFQNTARQTSAHYGVEDDVIHQYVDEANTAWHAGDYDANTRSIGIEHSAMPGRAASDATYASTIWLITGICQRYGLDPTVAILPHQRFTATSCPGTMDLPRIIAGVQAALSGVTTQSGTITPITTDWFDMASLDDLANVLKRQDVADAIAARVPYAWFSNKYGRPVQFESLLGQLDLNVNNNHSAVMGALLSVAQGIGGLKAQPASFDAKALAAELAPLLTTNQAHQFIVALGQALPKQ